MHFLLELVARAAVVGKRVRGLVRKPCGNDGTSPASCQEVSPNRDAYEGCRIRGRCFLAHALHLCRRVSACCFGGRCSLLYLQKVPLLLGRLVRPALEDQMSVCVALSGGIDRAHPTGCQEVPPDGGVDEGCWLAGRCFLADALHTQTCLRSDQQLHCASAWQKNLRPSKLSPSRDTVAGKLTI